MGFDSYVKLYFFDKDNEVIKRIVLNSYKYEAVSTFSDIMPEAKSLQVCFDNDYDECKCYLCKRYEEYCT